MSPVPREGEVSSITQKRTLHHWDISEHSAQTQSPPRDFCSNPDTASFHHWEKKYSLLCNFKGHSIHLFPAKCSMVNCSLS